MMPYGVKNAKPEPMISTVVSKTSMWILQFQTHVVSMRMEKIMEIIPLLFFLILPWLFQIILKKQLV